MCSIFVSSFLGGLLGGWIKVELIFGWIDWEESLDSLMAGGVTNDDDDLSVLYR